MISGRHGATSIHAATVLDALGSHLLKHERSADAEPALSECLAIRKAAQPDAWATFHTESMLGASLLGQNKLDEAEPLLLAGHMGMKQREATIPPRDRARLTEAIERLVQLYEETGQKDDAAKWRKILEARKKE